MFQVNVPIHVQYANADTLNDTPARSTLEMLTGMSTWTLYFLI